MLKRIDEPWDPYQMRMALSGGNKQWTDFMFKYRFTDNEKAIKLYYKTDASQYYRKMVKAKATGLKFDREEPPVTSGEAVE